MYELLCAALKFRAAFVPQESVQGLTVSMQDGLKMQRPQCCVFKEAILVQSYLQNY